MYTTADRELALMAATQYSIFTLDEARIFGLTHGQVDWRVRRVWESVHDGVYRVPGAVPTWASELYAACRAATRPVAVARRAAAAFYGLPYGSEQVEIECRRWRRSRRSGLIVHESTRLSDEDVVVVEGIPIVRAERLVLEMAGILRRPDAVERFIQAARRKRMISYDSMLATFERLARKGLPGVRVTRAALERWDPRSAPTESEMETWLVQILRRHGFAELVTQFVVRDEFGNFVARTDGALPSWRITIEYQSKQEHLDEFQVAADDRRRNAIIAAGYKPLAARYEDLRSGGHALVADIRRIIRNAA
jgi:hypothetical protein